MRDLWLLECTAMKANGLCGHGSIGIGLNDGIDDNSDIRIIGTNIIICIKRYNIKDFAPFG